LAILVADYLASRSLAFQYRLGGLLGRLILLSGGMRRRLREQLQTAGYAGRVSRLAVAAHLGRMAVETLALWRTDANKAAARVIAVEGWDRVLEAQAARRGLILLTPHLASFEYAAFWIGAQMPLTVMYRPPRQVWADALMRGGRARLGIRPVPADLSGVRTLLQPCAAVKRSASCPISARHRNRR
jgi:Lauroyl/myristoyl acyltransferase